MIEEYEKLSDEDLIKEQISMLESYDRTLRIFEDFVELMSEKEKLIKVITIELAKRNIKLEEEK